jgi:geranylgeranyl diphosphate synthase, type I
MSFNAYMQIMLPAVEGELERVVDLADGPGLVEYRGMLAYHLGWEGEGAGAVARGKRIRPLLTLLCAASCGADWQPALPAAAAVELVHNFSLIHDDIQDNSDMRHGRPTIWKLWGVAQAINAGDAMFTLAHLSMLRLEQTVSPVTALRAMHILHNTCLHLTMGQYLDLSYEARGDLTLEAYWPMVEGKTAALLAGCAELGALAGRADGPQCAAFHQFGRSLGLAFQALDDLLGIWGDQALTGKSAESDLLSGKKSLPVLYGLSKGGPFARRWNQGAISPAEVPDLARQLEAEGARVETQAHAARLTDQALDSLAQATPQSEAGEALHELTLRLLKRQG